MKRTAIATIVLLALAAGSAAAQNLLDNNAYRTSLQLRAQAQTAYNNGEFSRAAKLAKEAQSYATQAVEMATAEALAYDATDWLGLAKGRYLYATGIRVPARYPKVWRAASDEYHLARITYAAKQYERSITDSRAVVSALAGIAPQTALPRYYVVRLMPNHRDSFWRIAGYPFVYGNPLKWPVLYKANKDILQNPNNPNLIQPGMKFVIPSINSEVRKGTWVP